MGVLLGTTPARASILNIQQLVPAFGVTPAYKIPSELKAAALAGGGKVTYLGHSVC